MSGWDAYKKTMTIADTLALAAKAGDNEGVCFFLERGDINAKDERGYSPLMLACYNGQSDMAKLLIAKGADVNSADGAGNNILMGVCFKGNAELATLLIAAGAAKEARNQTGQTAKDIANTFGRADIVKLLA